MFLATFAVSLWLVDQLVQDPDSEDLLPLLSGGTLEFALALVGALLLRRSKRLAAVYAND